MSMIDDRAVCATACDLERLAGNERESLAKRLSGAIVRAWDTVLVWQYRAEERHHLAQIDERMLKDMGLSAADVEGEITKPFWRP